MKLGEKITVERVPSGAYKITTQHAEVIGNAASTIILLSHVIFAEEAMAEDAEGKPR